MQRKENYKTNRVVKVRDGVIRKNYLNETKLTVEELEW